MNTTPTATTTKAKRTKNNYDVTKGEVITALTAKKGMHLNELHAAVNAKRAELGQTAYNFPVIYAAVKQLRAPKTGPALVFGTGANKNEGLYLTEADAILNKPAAAVGSSKATDPFELRKLITVGEKKEQDVYKKIEGFQDEASARGSYTAASAVPNTVFQIVKNEEGKDPEVIEQGIVKRKELLKLAEAAKVESEAPATA